MLKNVTTFLHLFHLFDITLNKGCVCVCVCVCVYASLSIRRNLGGFPDGAVVKNLPTNAGDTGDTGSSLGQNDPLEEETATHWNSCLENSMDRGAWWAAVHVVPKESDITELHYFSSLSQLLPSCRLQ